MNNAIEPESCHHLHELPLELLTAALNFCVRVHHDNPRAVCVMLDDLRRFPPERWPWLTEYFRTRLPKTETTQQTTEVIL
jgi:hypothetical protein